MKNRIKKVLDKFNITYNQYGDRDSDAIDFMVNDIKLTLSAFDDDVEMCCFCEEDKDNKVIISSGYTTYEDVISNCIIRQIINKKRD